MTDGRYDKVYVGDRVKHRCTRQWGTLLEVRPQADGTAELLVQRDEPLFPDWPNDPTWWSSYRLDWGEIEASRLDGIES